MLSTSKTTPEIRTERGAHQCGYLQVAVPWPVAFAAGFVITLLVFWASVAFARYSDGGTCIGAAVLGLDGAHTTYPIECGP